MTRLWGKSKKLLSDQEQNLVAPNDFIGNRMSVSAASEITGATDVSQINNHEAIILTETNLETGGALESRLMNADMKSSYKLAGVGHSTGAPTIIRAGLHLEGSIKTADDILLEGTLRGEVVANSITIAAGATLSGSVSASVIVVDGSLDGVVRCIKLQVNTTGAVSGEIHNKVLVVESGAVIEGSVFRNEKLFGGTQIAGCAMAEDALEKISIIEGPENLKPIRA
jgi:cytoskeletal protein CcmA (bactofilin family)